MHIRDFAENLMLMFILTIDKRKVITRVYERYIIIGQMQDITHWVKAQFMTVSPIHSQSLQPMISCILVT